MVMSTVTVCDGKDASAMPPPSRLVVYAVGEFTRASVKAEIG
jgi:hypothetical protein